MLLFKLVVLSSSHGHQVSHRSHLSLLHPLVRFPGPDQAWMLSPRFFNLCATHLSPLLSPCQNLSTVVPRQRSIAISNQPRGQVTMTARLRPARLSPGSAAAHHPLPRSHLGRRRGLAARARSLAPGRRKRSIVVTARSLVEIGAHHHHRRHHRHQAVLQARLAQPSQSLIMVRSGRLHPSVNAELS